RNGRAPVGELRYYADTRLDRFTTPLGKAQLGAALAMVGDKERAERAFAAALGAFAEEDKLNLARSDYGSEIRDGAALITLASETNIVKSETPRLVNVIAKAYLARNYTSTQEQAWMILAAHALGEQAAGAKLAVNNEPIDGSLIRALSPEELENGITITNSGDTETDAVVSVIGASLTPEPAVAKGFTISRTYYTLDGNEIDLTSANGGKSEIAQNERLVAVLKIESDEAAGRVLLVDRLPAGLEIENPRLVDSGDIKSLDWLRTTRRPEHTEFRDDRFVAAFDLWGSQSNSNGEESSEQETDDDGGTATEGNKANAPAATATVAYVVRAVTPGSFVHPAATIEDMYRPERYARSGAGTLVVKPKS
ncbi:MAG: alpha-2-macroglobulin family protein, partial [Rhizobiales bacterium]|nr:alpha-2-macroglobulin family protein [Hyphomicrobiales bacterium]